MIIIIKYICHSFLSIKIQYKLMIESNIYFGGSIEEEWINKLSEAYQKSQKVNIFIESGGGRFSIANVLLKIINNHYMDTTITAVSYVGSASFWLFMNTKCYKALIADTIGLYHSGTVGVNLLTSNGKINNELDKAIFNAAKDSQESVNFLKRLNLTPSEIRRYNRGEDIIFKYSRMAELIKIKNEL